MATLGKGTEAYAATAASCVILQDSTQCDFTKGGTETNEKGNWIME
jgi:hypothetical protein